MLVWKQPVGTTTELMRKRLFTIFILLFLVACNNAEDSQNDNSPSGTTPLATQTMIPTPTLAPGVPTRMPETAETTPVPAIPTVTPTPSITPTATPEPAERFPLGQLDFFHEDYESAVHEFQLALAAGVLDEEQNQEALLKLGQSFFQLGDYQAAADTFNGLLARTFAASPPTAEPEAETAVAAIDPALQTENAGQPKPSDAYYWLAMSLESIGDCPAAVGAYNSYLSLNPDMAAYIQSAIADCYLTLEDRTAAYAALEAATEGDAPNLVRLRLHRRLADMYLADANYEEAISEYEAILSFAVTDATRGQTYYLIGTAALDAGNVEIANENFLTAVTDYPQAYESYLALVALIDASVEVDPFQRGLVDYYAEAYEPAIAAFNSYIDLNSVHREDVHLYLAWSYEALGNVTAALSEVDAYIEANEPPPTSGEEEPATGDLTAVANGLLEKGKMQARAGMLPEAIASYQSYVERFPNGADAAYAAWWSAEYTERLDDIPGAIALYQAMASNYSDHQDADEALFHAGLLYRDQGSEEEALALWQETADTFPDQMYGAASLLWLMKTLPPEEAEPFRQQALALTSANYFALRAVQEAEGTMPFTPAGTLSLDIDVEVERVETEAWLRDWLQLEPETDLRTLPPELAADPRLIRGEKLWRLGLRDQARAELEAVRQANQGDILLSYHLALFLQNLGLYRSSITAAETVMRGANVNGLTAPAFLARLAYPIYYADLVTAEAEKYGYDPLLQFSLIRQESLFESFAVSTAVAQGLSQVIPDTGAYIAAQLGWPDYENEDLYRPYVGIAFGAFYLDQQLRAFDGFVPAALSAYNAGPGNAARWYAQAPNDIDNYHEIVDFTETRSYIERIFVGHVIYRHLYGVE
ncbi:MAG: tetratricopeptide repeat protein [Candidatus Promineifilaceae bacterium]